MLIGYDVEWTGGGDVTPRFLEAVSKLHNSLGIPATLFVVGQTLEMWINEFQSVARDPLFDIQQHTYSHQLLKTVYIEDGKSVRVVRGVSLERIRAEVHKTNSLLREHLGVDCIGLTGPWCYYRGLRDRPDILEVLWDEGIRFTRTDGRNQYDYHPVLLDLQPYWYEHVGFPDMLETTIHGWHDSTLRDILGWDNLGAYVESVKEYIRLTADENLVFSYVQHDWTSTRSDPGMSATEAILRYAQECGTQFRSYLSFYQQSVNQANVRAVKSSSEIEPGR